MAHYESDGTCRNSGWRHRWVEAHEPAGEAQDGAPIVADDVSQVLLLRRWGFYSARDRSAEA